MDDNNSKEVNLLQLLNLLFQWLKNMFVYIINICGKTLQLLYKYKWITIIAFVLSISVGLYLSRSSARIYKAEAMAVINGADAQTLKEILKQLENSLSTDTHLSLTAKMGIPDSVSKNIVAIRTFDVIDYLADGTADKVDFNKIHALDDTLNLKMNDRLFIQIKTYKIGQVPLIQEALLKYFTKFPILSSQFEAQKKYHADQIKICDVELLRIDSLAKIMYFKENLDQIKFENNKLIVGETRKQLFYNELLEIGTRKTMAEIKLAACINPVDFPSNFVVSPNPVNSRIKYLVYSLFIATFISIFLALLFNNINKIIAFLENK